MDVEELRSGGAMHVILLLFCGKSSKDSLARFLFFSSILVLGHIAIWQ